MHPSHVAIVNETFSPNEAELAHARGLIAAVEAAEREGSAAVTCEGLMVDYAMVPHRPRAASRSTSRPRPRRDEYERMVRARGIAQDSHAWENTSAPGMPKNTERMYATANPFRSLPSRAIHSAPAIGILRSQGML